MSSVLASSVASLQLNQSVVQPTQYVVAISLAILLYDYSITLGDEVNWIWSSVASRRPTLITILFFLIRYFSILTAPVLIVQYFWESTDPGRLLTCQALTSFHHTSILVSQGLAAAIIIARTYALYNKNRYILIFLCSLASAIIGLGVWGVIEAPSLAYRVSQLPPRGCILPISLPSIETFMPALILGIVVEIIVFVMTLYKSVQVIRRENTAVIRILLRDGALYFGIVMVVNIALLVSYYVSDDYSRGNVATLANSIYSTLISRLILNLRDPMLSSDRRFRTALHIAHHEQPQSETADILTTVLSQSDEFYSYGSEVDDSVDFHSDSYHSWGTKQTSQPTNQSSSWWNSDTSMRQV